MVVTVTLPNEDICVSQGDDLVNIISINVSTRVPNKPGKEYAICSSETLLKLLKIICGGYLISGNENEAL